MGGYFNAIGEEFKKSWWNAVVIIVFTIARLLFGWDWFKAGVDKFSWFSDGKADSKGMIMGMVNNLVHSHGSDPLHLNNLLIWLANNLFIPMSGLTDFLVVACETLIGIFVFFGFGFVWAILVATFLNLQYAAAGAANNFGYLVTDIVWLKWPSYASLIGVDGYIRYRRGKKLVGAPSKEPNGGAAAV